MECKLLIFNKITDNVENKSTLFLNKYYFFKIKGMGIPIMEFMREYKFSAG